MDIMLNCGVGMSSINWGNNMFSLKKILFFVIAVGGLWMWWNIREEEVSQIESLNLERPVLEVVQQEEAVLEVDTSEEVFLEITEETVEKNLERFHYDQLDEDQRVIYRALRDGVIDGDVEIEIDTDDASELNDIYRLVMFDHPEFFWITGSGMSTVHQWSDNTVYTTFEPVYGHVGAEREAMQAEIDEAVDEFISSIDPNSSEYEMVRAVYEHLNLTTTYNLDAPDHQNIYSVFVNKESVCAGISKAAQLLLNRLGIFATYVVGDAYVPGTSTQPVGHAWNLVRVDGMYYYLDVTWGSPGFLEGSALADRIEIVYDYLLLNEALLFRTHTLDESIFMPPATSLQHNFFVMNDMFYSEPDTERALEAMNTSILNEDEWVAFKFLTPELYQSMRSVILDDLVSVAASNLAQWYGLDSVQYYVSEKENLNILTIYWIYTDPN